MNVAAILFWLAIWSLLYVYFGYPLLLWSLARIFPRRLRPVDDAEEPAVTMIVSAYNEEAIIERKLENCTSLDYPKDKLEVIVVSDASDDRTDEIVQGHAARWIRLLRMPCRGGKTIGLNRAVAEARGEIVIFSDANAMYDRKAVRNLLRNFSDPAVGCVTGESRYFFDEESASVKSENLYWTYEIFIKKLESRLGSTVGGDGAIYALRKSLYEPMEASDLSDFVNPLQVVRRGFRNIYDPEAYCIEAAAESFEKEFRRKVRIVNRAWRGLWNQKKVLNPFRYGFFAIQVWSHKLLRWCIPLFLMLAFATNLILAGKGSYYTGTLFLQIAFYMLAWVGGRFSGGIGRMRMFYVPYYFSVVNWASLLGIIENFRGNTFVVWDTVREESSNARA